MRLAGSFGLGALIVVVAGCGDPAGDTPTGERADLVDVDADAIDAGPGLEPDAEDGYPIDAGPGLEPDAEGGYPIDAGPGLEPDANESE